MSDFQTGFEYLEGQTFEETVNDLNDSRVANETSTYLANATTRTCTLISEQGDSFTFSCVQQEYKYGVLTFVFIFAPSGNVLKALMGPAIGGAICMLWGLVMIIVGGVLIGVGVYIKSVAVMLFGFFICFLGVILYIIGPVGAANKKDSVVKTILKNIKNNWQFVLLAPFIILLSPATV